MRKTIVVAVREYQAAVKTKAFIISLVLMPVLMGGAMAIQALMHDRVDTTDKHVAIFDETGQLYSAIAEALRQRNESDRSQGGIYAKEDDTRVQVAPRFLVEKVEAAGRDIEQIRFDLSERVRADELLGFVIIPSGALDVRPGGQPVPIDYHSNRPTYDDFHRWLSGKLDTLVREQRLASANVDLDVVNKALQPVPVSNKGLVAMDDAGNITVAEDTNITANVFVPLGLMMLMFMVVMIAAQPLMQTVIEEKMQRIAEVLLASVTPFELMMGKLLGVVGVSLTIATLYLCGAFVAVHKAGFGNLFPAHLVWWFVVFQAMAVLMYGSIFIAIGAAVTDLREAQSLLTPVMLFVVAPMFVWIKVVREPNSSFALTASLIPPVTPMLMTIRQAVPPGVPSWQPALGIGLVLLTTIVCVYAASRIFRIGILMQGKGAKLGEIVQWVFRG